MPTYDYRCNKCRHRFEEVQSFSSEPVATCPDCGGSAARQFTVPVVVYKGSGFYTTDHGRGSTGNNGSSKKSGDGDSSSKNDNASAPASRGDRASSAKAEGDSASKNSEDASSSKSVKSEKKEAAKASSSSGTKN